MTILHILEIIINSKNYCQITINKFQDYTNKNFEKKFF